MFAARQNFTAAAVTADGRNVLIEGDDPDDRELSAHVNAVAARQAFAAPAGEGDGHC
jgi:hypothetical protein